MIFSEIAHSVVDTLQAMSHWEFLAVVLAMAYLLLALGQSIWCWPAAFFSTAIYTVLFWNVSLLMESALNVYYLVMAVYGWYLWHAHGPEQQAAHVHSWRWQQHLLALGLILTATLISGYLLENNTSASWPYLDSFTTWASVFTTWMVARKVLENWLYWVVIDALSIVLYVDKGLYLTALLFAAYVIIAAFGYIQWRRTLNNEDDKFSPSQPAATA